MNKRQLLKEIQTGEDSTRQFKVDVKNVDSLASEMVAFSNSQGGTILIGVDDNGKTVGLAASDVKRINQLISNAASQHVRSPISPLTKNVPVAAGKTVIVLTVPEGMDKPYFDKNGVIWLKSGPDKRRVHSKEELKRIFQGADQFHGDELPTKAGIEKIDRLRFRDFIRDVHKLEYPDSKEELTKLLQNMNLATDKGVLNLAGVLLFAEKPEMIKPQFVVKAIRFPGDRIHVSEYEDTEDFEGPLSKVFEDSMSFIMRNLHKVQAGRGVNAPGIPEIPRSVFEELLVNALVHRDYLIDAPIRIFIFSNRIEIISPGSLPNNLTVEKIKTGNSNIRNPILVSYAAKGLLPYHGIGSGITRALEEWADIEFEDMRDGGQFKATIARAPENAPIKPYAPKNGQREPEKQSGAPINAPINAPLTPIQRSILTEVRAVPEVSYDELALILSKDRTTIMRNVQKLKEEGILVRVGSKKTGHWEVRQPGNIDGR